MGSKKLSNYQWKLFFPLVAILCFIIATLVFFQYKREKSYRTDAMMQQLSLISERIITAYERETDLSPFMSFLNQYFDNSNVNVSIYDRNGCLLHYIGNPIKQNSIDPDKKSIERRQAELTGYGTATRYSHYDPDAIYLYSATKSDDGEIFVHTAIPYELTIFEAIASEPSMWIVIFSLVVVTIVIAFYASRHLGRNIKLLNKFAISASGNSPIEISADQFPNDELGEISRQITHLYNEKVNAINQSKKEHEIAMLAIEEKMQIKRQLTNNLNHELKTPIGIIKGYIETILSDTQMPQDTIRSFLSKAFQHVQRLTVLLNDISTLTRLDEGHNLIPLQDVNFHDLIFSIDNDIKTIPGNNLTFKYDIPIDCHVSANYNLLNDVILNLVRNAIAYSSGTEMGIYLVESTPQFHTFTFYDNGIGVPNEHIPHLFDRFYRIDTGRSRKAGGTGLGLPIVKNTITTHGGEITVRNRPQGGLEFTFTLPCLQQHTSRPKAEITH